MLFQSEGTHSIWCCQLGIQAPILYVYHADRNLCSTKLMAKSQFDEPEEEASGWGNRLVAVRGMSSRYFSRYPMAMFLVASTPSFILAQHIYHIYIYITHIIYIYYVICIYIYHTYHIYIYICVYILCMARLFADLTTLQKALVCKWIQVQAQPEPEIWVPGSLGLRWPRAIWLVAFPLFNNMVGYIVGSTNLVGWSHCLSKITNCS